MAKRKIKTTDNQEIVFSDPPLSVIKSLADLAPRHGTVIVERQDGEQLAIPYRELSYKRWWEIGRMVEDPAPLKAGQGHDDYAKDENGKLIKVYNVDWIAYEQARLDAANRRAHMRLAAFIDLPFEGATLEDRTAELIESVPNDIIQALSIAMHRMVAGSEARIESRAENFHANGGGNHGDLPEDALVG